MIRFLAALLILTLLLAGGVMSARHLGWVTEVPSYFFEILVFVSLTTLVLYRYLHRVPSGKQFVQFYLLTTVLKLLGYGAFGFVIIILDRPGAAANTLFFIITYVAFTALETFFLYQKSRNA
jgi:fumarate reductase subunit D